MLKRETPTGMLLVVALLVIYAAYAFLLAAGEKSWLLGLVGIVAVWAAIATATLRTWSRFLVYALAAGFIGKLAYSIFSGWGSGYFQFQFQSQAAAVRSLVPTLIMAVLSCICCWIVYRHFARRSGA